MKTRTVWTSVVLSSFLLAGCFNDDHDGPSPNNMGPTGMVHLKENIGINMGSVVGFTLVPEGAATTQTAPFQTSNSGDCMLNNGQNGAPGDGACIKLYALSDTGGVIPVELVELIENQNNQQDGGYQQPSIPDTIYNVGKFVFFVFSGSLNTEAGQCKMVVLQKSDGALYCSFDAVMTCLQVDGCFNMPSDKIVQANRDGTLVHGLGSQQALLQLDFANPASAVSRTLFDPTDGMLSYFLSNGNGDALTTIQPSGANTTDLRLFKRSGGFVNLPAFSTNTGGGPSLCVFSGLNGDEDNFYVITPHSQYQQQTFPTELQNRVTRIGLVAGAVTTTTYAHDATGGMAFNLCGGGGGGASQASTRDRHFITFPNNMGNITNEFTEVYNPEGILTRHSVPGLATITRMYGCDDQLIFRGRDAASIDVIARYYPESGTSAVVTGSQDYTITAVAVSDSCEVTFGGRRAADNARILGNIPANSSLVTVYSNNLPGDVKALVRIR